MKKTSFKEHIHSLGFFSNLEDSYISILQDISQLHSYESDYILYYEKEQNQNIFFLLDGLARAYKIDKFNNEIFLYYIYPNSVVSDISNIANNTLLSFSNVKIIETSLLLAINFKKFKEIFLDSGYLCGEFSNEVMKNSLRLQQLINREFIFNSVSKVAMMLHKDLEIFNKLKRSEISLILNIQPETLSRVLNRLKRDRIVDSVGGDIIILNQDSLRALYEE